MRSDPSGHEAVMDTYLDDAYLLDTLTTLLRTPAEAPLGQNFIDPRDPQVEHFINTLVRPHLSALAPSQMVQDEDNNVVASWGDTGPAFLLMPYSSSHHGNLMSDPYSGAVKPAPEYGVPEVCAFGRGAGKKGALAAVLAAVRAVRRSGVELRGTLAVAVNTEGYSSHRGSEAVYAMLDAARIAPVEAIMCFATGLRGGVGTRGRVDILVDVVGREAHSSVPESGLSAIEGARLALERLRGMRFERRHPRLGAEQLTPYKLTFAPVAPHTIPEIASFRLDRRIVPGTDIDEVVEEVRTLLAGLDGFSVDVQRGPYMLPWEVDADAPIVKIVGAAYRAVTGREFEVRYAAYTTDTGSTAARSIPVVEFGPHAYSVADRPTAAEFVSVESVRIAARVYLRTILEILQLPR
jgi:acetylornithine deacetylase/succinyl-diaminopimelate desuccinylase-like protein